MDTPASKEAADKSISTKSAVETDAKDFVEVERSKAALLTSNSTSELEKLISELEALQEFLKSETGRVQDEIESVLDGIKIIVEAISPWKTADVARAQNTRANGHDKIKRWP
jgi:Mn-dependent DtxR family transcriptional regulator